MLTRLESLYLNILRVVILIVATIALAAAVLSATTAVSSLAEAGGFGAEEPSGGTLGQWVAEQKASAAPADAAAAESDTTAPEVPALPDIENAAANVEAYLGKDNIDRKGLTGQMQSVADKAAQAMPAGDTKYAASVLRLTEELKASKGKKLSPERVMALLKWHADHFGSNVAADAAKKTEAQQALLMKLGVAGAAFLAFVLVIFVFIFVKIERNLRRLPAAYGEGPAADVA